MAKVVPRTVQRWLTHRALRWLPVPARADLSCLPACHLERVQVSYTASSHTGWLRPVHPPTGGGFFTAVAWVTHKESLFLSLSLSSLSLSLSPSLSLSLFLSLSLTQARPCEVQDGKAKYFASFAAPGAPFVGFDRVFAAEAGGLVRHPPAADAAHAGVQRYTVGASRWLRGLCGTLHPACAAMLGACCPPPSLRRHHHIASTMAVSPYLTKCSVCG